MVNKSYIKDEEKLYRSVRADSKYDEYIYNEENKLIISYKAFQDRNKEPSVDRALLRDNKPKKSKLNSTDGIVSLITKEVRKIADVKTSIEDKNGDGKKIKKTTAHIVDVEHKPVINPNNDAHSEVVVTPAYLGSETKKGKTFTLLKRSLARLATTRGWTIEPS